MFGVMLVQRLLVALAVWKCVDIAARIGGDEVWPAAFGCAAFVAYVKLAPIAASPLNETKRQPMRITPSCRLSSRWSFASASIWAT